MKIDDLTNLKISILDDFAVNYNITDLNLQSLNINFNRFKSRYNEQTGLLEFEQDDIDIHFNLSYFGYTIPPVIAD